MGLRGKGNGDEKKRKNRTKAKGVVGGGKKGDIDGRNRFTIQMKKQHYRWGERKATPKKGGKSFIRPLRLGRNLLSDGDDMKTPPQRALGAAHSRRRSMAHTCQKTGPRWAGGGEGRLDAKQIDEKKKVRGTRADC